MPDNEQARAIFEVVQALKAADGDHAKAEIALKLLLRQWRTLRDYFNREGIHWSLKQVFNTLDDLAWRLSNGRPVDVSKSGKFVSELCESHHGVPEYPTFIEQMEVCARVSGPAATEDPPGRRPAKKVRKKTPAQYLKETRERHAARELAKNPEITSRALAETLECNPSTVVRLEAWKKRGQLHYDPPRPDHMEDVQ